MKTFRTIAVLAAVLTASGSLAFADSVTLGSFATGTTAASLGYSSSETAMNFAGYTAFPTAPFNPTLPTLLTGTAATYALAPNGTWSNPIGNSAWVGSTPTSGPVGTVNPGYGYYQFNTLFTAAGGNYSGTLSVMADDTVEVLLNGTVIVPFGALGSDNYCSDSEPACTAIDTFALNDVSLLTGTDANMFTFVVDQAGIISGFDPSGVDFTASVSSVVAPEPASLFLLGTGLLSAAAFALRLRRRA